MRQFKIGQKCVENPLEHFQNKGGELELELNLEKSHDLGLILPAWLVYHHLEIMSTHLTSS